MKTSGNIVRAALVLGAGAVVLAAAPSASAQQKGDLGQQGQFILSADRLFPLFSFDDVSQDNLTIGGLPANESSASTTTTSTAMSFFYGSNGNSNDPFFNVPRLGFDYVLVPNVTVGGDLIVLFTLGGSTTTETDFTNGSNQKTSTSNPSLTGFGVAPRGGYILGLNDMFSLWLRGGFSFYTASSKQTGTTAANQTTTTSGNVNQFALDLEPQLVFTPVPHVGFTAGLDADIPLAGGHSEELTTGGSSQSVSAHSSIFYLGVELGMLVHF